uniref:uncharacterized protein LOC120332508 n=1 Tax=Styela clava TaxID=7725 RepID=UPI001939F23E|nr:uncharacterized protein LOC120332508 [Styela clava]
MRDVSTLYFLIFMILLGKKALSQWISEPSLPNYPVCSSTKTLTDISGEYNFKDDIYRSRDFCLYIVSEDHSTLSVRFLDFNFGFEDENGNCSNFLEIGTPKDSPQPQQKRYCGSKSPPPFVSSSDIVWIWVHREFMLRQSNIELIYDAAPRCNGDIVINSYTFLTSPKYPTSVFNCAWTILVRESVSDQPLQIQLTNWFIQNSAASLEIYDSRGGKFLARFDESTSADKATNVVITTTGPHAYVSFYSDTLGIGKADFNATVKIKGYCTPGTLPCGDGMNCYSHEQICNSQQDCSTGYDELGCGDCKATQFWCGREDGSCYNRDQRCNGFKDCPRSLQDETNCRICGPGSFLCKSDSKCIYERWRCDGDFDCSDKSDEQDCDYTASRRVITAAVIGSLVCSLLLVIALGCTCKLYSLRASHHRYSHHQYRATPLTRVERELFQRQAPPTYDMTISGTSTESASSTRSQRQRRRRNRRYQFQRAAPANIGHQCNNSSREESIESNNPAPPEAEPSVSVQPTVTSTSANPVTSEEQTSSNAELRQNSASFVIESIPDILAEMIFAPRQGRANPAHRNGVLNPVRTSTPIPIETRESGTQTSSNTNPGNGANTPNTTATTRQTPTTSSGMRVVRSTSRSRGRNRRSNSKDQQAKPLPKKKRILPVMVQAPCPDAVVEEDTLACVYPCPPSYSQAVESNDPKVESSSAETQNEVSLIGSINEDDAGETTDQVFSPEEDSLKTTKSSFFPFSLGQALRNITFSRFSKNPYLQIEAEDIIVGSNSNEAGVSGINSNAGDDNSSSQRQLRPSISSDESMLDCTFDTDSLGPNNELQDMSSKNMTTHTNSMTSGNNMKVFPKRKNNVNPFNTNEDSSSCNTSLDMSTSRENA